MLALFDHGLVFAQSIQDVLTQPWQEGPHWAETVDDVCFVKGETEKGNLDASVLYWNSYARIKLARDQDKPRFLFNYRLFSLGVASDLKAIDGDYWDIAFAGGARLGEAGLGWEVSLLGG